MNPDILFSKDVFTSIISYMDHAPILVFGT